MALIESLAIPLGTIMPEFELADPSNKSYQSTDLFGKKGLLIAFTCNHCPYAIAIWPRLIRLATYAAPLGIQTVAINPNINPHYPEDSPQSMRQKIEEWGIAFPYLVDQDQKVAKAFKAQCTPDLYLLDAGHKLAYHGRLDDNWQNEGEVTREELKEALDALVAGKAPIAKQIPSMGCSIKWC
jgi:peroxiredoxin